LFIKFNCSFTERVGDTFYNPKTPVEPLPGFRPAKAMVYAGLYAINAEETDRLHDSIHKLLLTDASVSVERESRFAKSMCGAANTV
jgi:translation elongation factor EF-4